MKSTQNRCWIATGKYKMPKNVVKRKKKTEFIN